MGVALERQKALADIGTRDTEWVLKSAANQPEVNEGTLFRTICFLQKATPGRQDEAVVIKGDTSCALRYSQLLRA
jgi:hypothetical protein